MPELTAQDKLYLQFEAALSLLEYSRLTVIRGPVIHFEPTDSGQFENHWPTIHPAFGRLLCWISFSIGAEYLAKVAGIQQGVLSPKPGPVIQPPTQGDLANWAAQIVSGKPPEQEIQYQGQMTGLCGKIHDPVSDNLPLVKLAKEIRLGQER